MMPATLRRRQMGHGLPATRSRTCARMPRSSCAAARPCTARTHRAARARPSRPVRARVPASYVCARASAQGRNYQSWALTFARTQPPLPARSRLPRSVLPRSPAQRRPIKRHTHACQSIQTGATQRASCTSGLFARSGVPPLPHAHVRSSAGAHSVRTAHGVTVCHAARAKKLLRLQGTRRVAGARRCRAPSPAWSSPPRPALMSAAAALCARCEARDERLCAQGAVWFMGLRIHPRAHTCSWSAATARPSPPPQIQIGDDEH